MTKHYGNSICTLLCLILSSSKGFWMFGKKPISLNGKWQVVKNDMYSMQNYRLVSLLPISGEIMTRFLYDSMFSFFTENNLISQNQSGFKPGDSYSNQLLFLTHDTYQSFDDDWKVSEVLLDITKTFGKVWHKGLIHKYKCKEISVHLITIVNNFLSNRYQKVAWNGQTSKWTPVNAGVR